MEKNMNFGKQVVVEYLYLDLQSCERCIGTDKVLDEVMEVLTPALEMAGYEVNYVKTEVQTAEQAIDLRFESSPTVRVNGQDICMMVAENHCGCCSDISSIDVDCRVFEYNGVTYEIPPHEMLADAVLRGVFGEAADDSFTAAEEASCSTCEGESLCNDALEACYVVAGESYGDAAKVICGELLKDCCVGATISSSEFTLPENLRAFFEGKAAESCCTAAKDSVCNSALEACFVAAEEHFGDAAKDYCGGILKNCGKDRS